MPRRHERLAGFPGARQRLAAMEWPVRFRATGGTPVPQSPAVINLALAVRCRVGSSAAHLEWGYHRLGDPWCDWLGGLGVGDPDLGPAPGAYCDGRFNVRIGGRKLVGTAQRWRRVRGGRDMALLVHGAMQVDDTPRRWSPWSTPSRSPSTIPSAFVHRAMSPCVMSCRSWTWRPPCPGCWRPWWRGTPTPGPVPAPEAPAQAAPVDAAG